MGGTREGKHDLEGTWGYYCYYIEIFAQAMPPCKPFPGC